MPLKAMLFRFLRVIGGYVALATAAAITVVAMYLSVYVRWGLMILIGIPILLFAISIISGVSFFYLSDELLSRFGPKRAALRAAKRLEAGAGKDEMKDVPKKKAARNRS